MKLNGVCAALAVLALALSGCTGRSGKKVTVEEKRSADQQTPSDGEVASIELDEEAIKATYDIDTNNLSYQFSYLSISKQDRISFNLGKARLVFTNLPYDTPGVLTLSIYEGAVLRLRGVKSGVMLKKGQTNNIDLALVAVDTGPQSTDLIIEAKLDPPTGGSSSTPRPQATTSPVPPTTQPVPPTTQPVPPTTQPVPTTTPTAPPTTQPVPPPTSQPVPPSPTASTDPIGDWDGRSLRGDARWRIQVVK